MTPLVADDKLTARAQGVTTWGRWRFSQMSPDSIKRNQARTLKTITRCCVPEGGCDGEKWLNLSFWRDVLGGVGGYFGKGEGAVACFSL